ncbi:MAG: ABC transporter permease subunit [Clostridiales bacterium]|nr:ABC transporter permease subunit [Clostridiales bacterium]
MRILQNEIKINRVPLLIWSLSIGALIAMCVFMFPDMKNEMDQVNKIFSSMGNFTAAFGMDQLNFGTLIGFYAVECGSIIGIGGAFYAAITSICALMNEEKNRTAEFLMTHPLTRGRVVTEKLLAVLSQITILNVIVLLIALGSIAAIGESVPMKDLLLMNLSYYLMQIEIAGLCFGISAFITKAGIGIGIGLACGMYMLNIISNISKDAVALKYVTAFGYTDGAQILNNGGLEVKYLAVGMALAVVGVVVAYVKYTKKDLRA